ncbi:MAG: DUF4870 domain-containing protein [Anaerolineales bacterium]|nr:DUF4870 domain-containing protein [Anaerolineales bacterium]MCX7608752.1 DUF4870 domain-containing protein [Anaerolineales bacterium]
MIEQPFTPEISQDDKLWALLSYIFSPIIPIIMLLLEEKKSRPFIKFHAVQALIMGIVAIVLYTILGFIIVGFCLGLAVQVYMIYVGIKAFGGETVTVPVVTDMIKKNNWA